MTATIITLANAIVTELNEPADDVEWSQEFTAERKYLIRRDLEDIDSDAWLVSVGKAGQEREIADRNNDLRRMVIDVGVQKKINPTVLEEGDAVLNLIEEFEDYWLRRRPAAMNSVICVEANRAALYVPEQLAESLVATAFVRLTFWNWQ